MPEVLEHLTDETIAKTTVEIARVLKDEAIFLCTVPAEEYLSSSEVCCPCCGKVFHRWGHIQSFTADKLNNAIKYKFKNMRISRHYFSESSELNWKEKFVCAIKEILVFCGYKGDGETFFSCQKINFIFYF